MYLNIYYIDDERDLLDNFNDLFSSEEIIITTFQCPKIALEKSFNFPPDIFFIDYTMPEMSGEEFAKRLDDKIIKVLISGNLNILMTEGFSKVFEKPFKEEEILNFINDIKFRIYKDK